ncbi:MAG: zinc transporter ZntB [Aliarcobacter sp.]|nr:zinc transporter ZntB [Aliarcobacter sp.]
MNHALLLDRNGNAKELSYDEINGSTLPEDGILWVHFDYSSQMAKDWIRNKSGIDSVAMDALLTEETRPRTTILNDSFLIALRGINLNPNSKPEDMVSIRLFISSNLIITTKRRNLLSIDEIMDSLKKGIGPKSSSEFLNELTYRVTSRMEGVIDELEDRTDSLEESLMDSSDSKFRSELMAIRRETIILRRYLFPQKEAMSKLYHDKVTWISDYEKIELRETNDQLMRYIEELDTIRDKVALIQEELSNKLSEQMNKKMYVLSIISVIFLPLTFLTGLLGINVDGIPGADNERAFFNFLVILIAIATFQLILFKKKKWI